MLIYFVLIIFECPEIPKIANTMFQDVFIARMFVKNFCAEGELCFLD